MDIGIFLGSKKRTIAWILAPLLVLSIVYASSSFYFTAQETALDERKFFVEAMPIIIKKIAMAESMVERYQLRLPEEEVIERLNAQLNQIAERVGFSIDSLVVKREAAKGKGAAQKDSSVFSVSVKGNGTFEQLIAFLNETKSSRLLFTLDTIHMNFSKELFRSFYNTQLELSYHNVQ